MYSKFRIVLLFSSILLSSLATAQDITYPELHVTPRASDRVKLMAEEEKQNGLFFQMPFQISAASTLVAGLLQFGNVDEKSDPDKKSPLAGIIVGAGWLGINYYLGHHYNVYQNTQGDVSKISGNSMRDQLTRERFAEEGMSQAARLGRKLKWMSVLSNVAANTYMISNTKKDSLSEVVNGVAILAALGPLFFETSWESAWRDQQNYKKKIYGPVVSVSSGVFSVGQNIAPGLGLNFKF